MHDLLQMHISYYQGTWLAYEVSAGVKVHSRGYYFWYITGFYSSVHWSCCFKSCMMMIMISLFQCVRFWLASAKNAMWLVWWLCNITIIHLSNCYWRCFCFKNVDDHAVDYYSACNAAANVSGDFLAFSTVQDGFLAAIDGFLLSHSMVDEKMM